MLCDTRSQNGVDVEQRESYILYECFDCCAVKAVTTIDDDNNGGRSQPVFPYCTCGFAYECCDSRAVLGFRSRNALEHFFSITPQCNFHLLYIYTYTNYFQTFSMPSQPSQLSGISPLFACIIFIACVRVRHVCTPQAAEQQSIASHKVRAHTEQISSAMRLRLCARSVCQSGAHHQLQLGECLKYYYHTRLINDAVQTPQRPVL